MIVKILGILDILAAVLFWLFGMFHILPSVLILTFAIYLLAKGIIFVISEHIASALDIVIALIMFLSLSFTIPKMIVFIIAFILIQKGIFSLVA